MRGGSGKSGGVARHVHPVGFEGPAFLAASGAVRADAVRPYAIRAEPVRRAPRVDID